MNNMYLKKMVSMFRRIIGHHHYSTNPHGEVDGLLLYRFCSLGNSFTARRINDPGSTVDPSYS